MDSLTHLTAGVITPFVFKRYPRSWALVIFGVICAQLPDIDAIAGQSAYTMFFVHRGYTHSLPFVLAAALLLGFAANLYFRRKPAFPLSGPLPGPLSGEGGKHWGFASLFACALFTLLFGHLYLDCMTTFGTRIFLPFSNYRVALPAMFIVDPLFTIPLVIAAVFIIKGLGKPEKRRQQTMIARIAVGWLLLYPLCMLGVAFYGEDRANKALAGQTDGLGQPLKAHVLTELFSPFVWKIVEERGDSYCLARYDLFSPASNLPGDKIGGEKIWPKPEPKLWHALRRVEPLFEGHAAFGAYTIESREDQADGGQIVTYAEMRYFTVQESLFRQFDRDDGLFMMQARLDAQNRLVASRYLARGKDAQSAPWQVYPAPIDLHLE